MHTIYFAGGCFWGVEEFFSRIAGVVDAESGYANGKGENPSYEQVCTNTTGFAETVRVTYDPTQVTLRELTERYFSIIDPTSVNRQGNDVGTQYRTGVYYESIDDQLVLETVFADVRAKHGGHIATELKSLQNFYLAEEYHQDYLRKNPGGYCHIDLSKV